jgi:hypothetical protein
MTATLTDALERWLAQRWLRRHARPAGDAPTVADDVRESLRNIKHVVVLMMENHSYDNYFGSRTRRWLQFSRGACELESHRQRKLGYGAASADGLSGNGPAVANLACQPHAAGRRCQRRVLPEHRGLRSHSRPVGAHGLLDRGRSPLLLRTREYVSAFRPVVLLMSWTHVPESPIPRGRHGKWADRRCAAEHLGLPVRRNDF